MNDLPNKADEPGHEFAFAEIDEFSLTELEEAELYEAESVAAPVSYSGQDFDVAGLVRRLVAGDILIPTFGHNDDRIVSAGFQRSFVWRRPQMDRFIESLLLGYPVPGILLVRQTDKRYLVLDGQQRLRTLQRFIEGVHDGHEFALKNVADQFQSLTYKTLSDDLRRQVDDTFLQATIVSTDGSPESLESIYRIFERLNSGGTQLTPHEIRVALYAGPLIDYLESLNKNSDWRALYGKASPRLRDQELILRILALTQDSGSYRRPLKTYLNAFAARHRGLAVAPVPGQPVFDSAASSALFVEASRLINSAGRDHLRPRGTQLNAALTEAVFVGLITRLTERGVAPTVDEVRSALVKLGRDENMEVVTSRSTADEESVRTRLRLGRAAFGDV